MQRFSCLFLFIFFLFHELTALGASSDFPIPDSIRPAIAFWTRVYTEADTNSGFLHDARNLNIVYGKLERDRDTINITREGIRADLEVLASGKRTGLTRSQQDLLDLWGRETSNERFRQAVGSVRWQLGQSDRFVEGIKRSGAYRSHIEKVIREKGLPAELAILPHVESSFHPGAYSSAAATGMWQFVRATAQRFMQVDYVVDQRLDPYAATYGAMELLEYNFNALGSWPLALTAYNHGANGMARAVRDVGSMDIGRIITEYTGPRFGFASRNFYPQFLAAMDVDRRAEEYFGSIFRDRAPDYQTVKLDAFMDSGVLASTLGVDIEDLKRDNPALQPSVWSGTKRIPRGYELKLDNISFRGDLVAGLREVPVTALYSEQIPDVSYKVRRGDSLSVIAERYSTSVSELVAINQLRDRNSIRVGQTLLLPQPDGSMPTLVVSNSGPQPVPTNGEYEVKRGDTISLIAERLEIPLKTVLSLNNLDNNGTIFPGQKLMLRRSDESLSINDPQTVIIAESDQSDLEDSEIEAELSIESGSTLADSVAVVEEGVREETEQQLIADLQSDPSDYTVRQDRTIEIQAAETLGHYAEWLGIRAWDIRRLNNMEYRQPVIIGNRLKLDFSKVDSELFEQKRRQFHRDLQADYFRSWRIRETEEHSIKRGEFLANLARSRSVPMWLFRQYNPDVDAGRIQIGQVVVFPVVEQVDI
jgi:membrane-bound lytic murein transglycosylase D